MGRIRMVYHVLLLLTMLAGAVRVHGQSTEVQQLLLNAAKLTQLKETLTDMKRGYTILSNGYNAIKNIASGNFSLHEVFLDGLLQVSPIVKKYHRVADIVRLQQAIVKEYRSAYGRFRSSGNFRPEELEYIGRVYAKLFAQSMDNLDALLMVITASRLRMNDEERLKAIDGIFTDTRDKLDFLRYFNSETGIMELFRDSENRELDQLDRIFKAKR